MKFFPVMPICVLSSLLMMPGCGRLVDWGKETFYQGEKRDVSRRVIDEHIRQVKVYDDFRTVGLFDVLWLSDEVRTAYADLDAARYAKGPDTKKAFLRRQLAENDNFISFYVLAFVPENVAPLGDKQSPWTIKLRSNGMLYSSKDIKDVELNKEYRYLLSDYWTRFKTVYHVKFPIKDLEGNKILHDDTKQLTVFLSTVDRSKEIFWKLGPKGILARDDS